MIRYLLDTTPLAAYLNGRPPAAEILRPWILNDEVATSILAYGEVVEYIKAFDDYEHRLRNLRELMRLIHPYTLSYSILEQYANIRRKLRPPYGPGLIGDIDTLIAATATQYGLTLVTADSDFRRLTDLDVMLVSFRG